MRVLDPPQPVKGTDGKYHLVYELVLTNSSPGTAKVESIQTMDAKSGEVVDSLAHADVAARTLLLGDISGQTAEEVAAGGWPRPPRRDLRRPSRRSQGP